MQISIDILTLMIISHHNPIALRVQEAVCPHLSGQLLGVEVGPGGLAAGMT